MAEQRVLQGWLLQLYEQDSAGVVVWVLSETGERCRFTHAFPVTCYAHGPASHLRALWKWLRVRPESLELQRAVRRDLFAGELSVLAVTAPEPAVLTTVFFQAKNSFPTLTWYDADLPLTLRYAAVFGVFPLGQVQVIASAEDRIQNIIPLDSPWDIDLTPPPLRVLHIKPDCDPAHAEPQRVQITAGRYAVWLSLQPLQGFLLHLMAHLRRFDPDLVLTQYGDTWLFPLLLEHVENHEVVGFNPNREIDKAVLQREANSYFTYGQTVYRGPQTHLFGRWHIDECNAMMYGDYGLDGVLESARVTAMEVQEVARKSPGAGITALQIVQALRQNILVPYQKQQVERFKTVRQLLTADRGGLVGQPVVGLHTHVAEIDFVSMYPSIMAHFNVSPETVGIASSRAEMIPEIGIPVDQRAPGFVPETLRPLLDKRIAIKTRLAELDRRDCRYAPLKARSAALKWLLVVCFGYLGYKNARFGRIEAHEAVTAYGRECLLRAKEAAEDLGYRVLHLYVDGLWVQKTGVDRENIQPLLEAVAHRTGLPIALEGVYKWIAFLPSRMDNRVPVANRYFGVFTDKTVKCRGIEARRRDTPPWIVGFQMDLLAQMARQPRVYDVVELLPDLIRQIQRQLAALRRERIPLELLLVTQVLSRELADYRVPSPAARAAAQLVRTGKSVRPGQRVRFLYTRGIPGVCAWDQLSHPTAAMLDVDRYRVLLIRAVHTLLQPFGVTESMLDQWLAAGAGYGAPSGVLPAIDPEVPLLSTDPFFI